MRKTTHFCWTVKISASLQLVKPNLIKFISTNQSAKKTKYSIEATQIRYKSGGASTPKRGVIHTQPIHRAENGSISRFHAFFCETPCVRTTATSPRNHPQRSEKLKNSHTQHPCRGFSSCFQPGVCVFVCSARCGKRKRLFLWSGKGVLLLPVRNPFIGLWKWCFFRARGAFLCIYSLKSPGKSKPAFRGWLWSRQVEVPFPFASWAQALVFFSSEKPNLQ